MKLLYATSASYPSELANRLQSAAMAREFKELLGSNFEFGVSESKAGVVKDTPVIEVGRGRSALLAFRYMRLIQHGHFTHVFCREDRLCFFLLLYLRLFCVPVKCVLELHNVNDSWRFWWTLRRLDGIIVVASGIKEYIEDRLSFHPPILVASGAVDLLNFEGLPSQEEARRMLNLPLNRRIAAYTGSFGFVPPWDYNPWKGTDVMLNAAPLLPSCAFVFAGGGQAEIVELKRRYPADNIVFLGHRAEKDIPTILQAADVLVLPNKSGYVESERYTSPLKLFQYMASGKPIVASDLPSIREIVGDEACFFFQPGDPHALASNVERALTDTATALEKAAQAHSKVRSWRDRAGRILAFMETLEI
jgi:glycosyltransferase involved in cell wall biosynthesis